MLTNEQHGKRKKKPKNILVQLNSVILGSATTGSARDLQIAEEPEEKLKFNFTKKQSAFRNSRFVSLANPQVIKYIPSKTGTTII